MTLVVAPDALALTIGWTKQQPELAGVAIGSKLPPNKSFPFLRIIRIDGTEVYGSDNWVSTAHLQLNAYDRDEAAAGAIARTVTALLTQRFHQTITVGTRTAVVSDVKVGGIWQGFDPVDATLADARFDAVLTIHP